MILIKHNNEGNLKPYFYFALEEYVMEKLLKEDEAYFFTWEIKGVVIGKNQVLENEVNLDYLKENNIDVYRRPTGGGAIYADENNTMYTMITKRTENFSFKPYLQLVIDAMKKLNLDIKFSGRNDLLFNDKKISGVAFLQNKYGFLIHGTYMYNVDIETMIRTITPNNEKLVSKGIESVRSRVENLKPFLNGMTQKELIKHLENEITTREYVLSDEEVTEIQERAKKFESKKWRFQVQPEHNKKLVKRIKGGLFEINLKINKGIIDNIKIKGDFFDLFPVETLEKAFINEEYTRDNMNGIFNKINIKNFFLDIDESEFKELLLSGIIE
ncbi:MAG TPA: lipoate--protein ligase [Acholeplasmataceae bacterium]|nr:lipoate--protein ligase [Acholeplasmataceae bacterium]